MTRYLAIFCCALALSVCMAVDASAQAAMAKTHVDEPRPPLQPR